MPSVSLYLDNETFVALNNLVQKTKEVNTQFRVTPGSVVAKLIRNAAPPEPFVKPPRPIAKWTDDMWADEEKPKKPKKKAAKHL